MTDTIITDNGRNARPTLAAALLEANPDAHLSIYHGYDFIVAHLVDGRGWWSLMGFGDTVAQALVDLEEATTYAAVTMSGFCHPGFTQAELDAARERAIAAMRAELVEVAG